MSLAKKREIEGGGPWTFENSDTLGPGETETFDFATMKAYGTNGYYKKWLPFDEIQITNLDTGNAVKFTVNGVYDGYVVPNASEGYSKAYINSLQIENVGSATIDAGNIKVEAVSSPYDADEAARDNAKQPAIVKAVKGVFF